MGAVVTLRDRTELEGLLRELNDVRSLADALRAQEHEFSHRLHVIAGLLELGRYDDAAGFISTSSRVHQELVVVGDRAASATRRSRRCCSERRRSRRSAGSSYA